ncbi:MAG: type I pullulanase [Ruminococcus sp.]|nr:type I pullulanase [Ruminococcus sp.]
MPYVKDYKEFDDKHFYGGDDLGAVIVDGKTQFRTWSPRAYGVYLKIYNDGVGNNLVETLPMERHRTGVWFVEILRNLDGYFYTFTYEFYEQKEETIDIYAKACGVNGERGAIVDFSTTNPDGWDKVKNPQCKTPCDAVIYETHVRDFTIDESSGVTFENRGKFLGFTQSGTTCKGVKTGIDHLVELGVTHVQLLPVEDYATVDESKPHKAQYNWGYDPKNYNCLEGSYSTDAEDPKKRIKEFKKLVMALHKKGIGVIMDVVYNHTYFSDKSAFHKSFPFYYHRTKDWKFTNGSGCGCETASERKMVRKYIADSLKFWVTEYKIDGFRFDLMALHDIETVNYLRDELDKINPQLLMYGEGWTGGESPLASDKLAYKWNSHSFGRVGLFNDNIRDGVKGGTFNAYDRGFVSGNMNAVGTICRALTGCVPHYQLKGHHEECCWAFEPTQSINYCEAHDNNTVWDKLCISVKDESEETRIKMDKLAAGIVILSQGVPFIHCGQDFLRTKPKILPDGEAPNDWNIYDENSYNAPDYTNSIKWERKAQYKDVFDYYKKLIALRKSSPLFRLSTKGEVESCHKFHKQQDNNLILYSLTGFDRCYVVMINPYNCEKTFEIPWDLWNSGRYFVRLDAEGKRNTTPIENREFTAPPLSLTVLKKASV